MQIKEEMSNKIKQHISSYYFDSPHFIFQDIYITPSWYCFFDINYSFIKNLSRNISIIEFGPGPGIFADYLIINGFKNILLVELCKKTALLLQEKYKNFKGIFIFNQDINSFLIQNKYKIDLIVSRHVIEHLNKEELLSFFEKSRKILNNKGIMIHETPNANNLIYNCWYRYGDFSHNLILNPKSYNELSFQYFNNFFKNIIKPHPILMLKYYLSKNIKNKIKSFITVISIYNKKGNTNKKNTYLKLFIQYVREYIAIKKSISFSKHYLQNEEILSPSFLAISKPK